MKKVIFMTVLVVFGLVLFSGCASMTGRTAGEHIDDASITTQANAIIVKDPDAKFFEDRCFLYRWKCCSRGFHT